MQDQYVIERLDYSHYSMLKELYRRVFSVRESVASITKRFDTSPVCLPVIGYIAIHKPTNTPAAYYGVFPFKAIIDGQLVSAAQSGDTMTHPDHRRKGFFVKLAQLTYEDCKSSGIRILIGQPNNSSYYGLVQRLGWTHLDDVIRWDLKLRTKTFPLPKLAKMLGLFKLYLLYAKMFLKKYRRTDISSFHSPLDLPRYARVSRDHSYLNYKNTGDKFFIRIDDTLMWIRLTDIFWIGDFDDYDKITMSVLKKLRRLAFRLGYNTISFNLNKSIPLNGGLQLFKKNSQQASCFLYLDQSLDKTNFILTAADSDTW